MDPEFTPGANANQQAIPYPTPASTSTTVPTILTGQDRQPNPANAYGTQVPMEVWIEHRVGILRDRYYASLNTSQRGAPMQAQGHTSLMAQQHTAPSRIPAFPLIGTPRPAENVGMDHGEVRVPVLPNLCSHPPNDGYTKAYPRQAPTTTTTVIITPFPAPPPGPSLQCTCPRCRPNFQAQMPTSPVRIKPRPTAWQAERLELLMKARTGGQYDDGSSNHA